MKKCWCVAVALMISPVIWADEPAPAGWKGRADLGFFSQSGSDGSKESLTFKAELNRQWGDFTLENRAEAISASDDSAGTGTARYLLASKQRFGLSKTDYLFTQEQFEKDSASEFRYQFNVTGGYGRTLFSDDLQTLVAEVGAGARYSEERDTGDSETSPIATGALDYRYKLTTTADFHQRLSVEGGSDSNIFRSLTELRLKLNDALGVAMGYDVKREYSDINRRLNVTTVSLSYVY